MRISTGPPPWVAHRLVERIPRPFPLGLASVGTLVGVALFYCYRDVFAILVGQWLTSDVYSYGVLIPPISAYMAWQCRDRLPPGGRRHAPIGGTALLVLGLAALTAGRRLGIVDVQELSLLPTIAGVTLLFGGYEALRAFALPILYLSLMMPVWEVVTDRLHHPFQLLSASLSGMLLSAAGVPVHQTGTYLALPSVTLEVARLCSGVNYLIGVGAIGIPLAYLAFRDTLRRTILLVSALTIAILGNAARIALIGFLLERGITTQVHGPGHILQGLAVAIVGYGALLGSVVLLKRWRRGLDSAQTPSDGSRHPVSADVRLPGARVWLTAVLVATVLAGVGAANGAGSDARPALGARLDALPDEIGPWLATNGPTRPRSAARLIKSRFYRHPSGRVVEVSFGAVVGSSSEGTSELMIDQFVKEGKAVTLPQSTGDTFINRTNGSWAGRSTTVLYWYDVQGRVVADSLTAKLWALWYTVRRTERVPVAVVVVPVPAVTGDEPAVDAMLEFAAHLVAALPASSDASGRSGGA